MNARCAPAPGRDVPASCSSPIAGVGRWLSAGACRSTRDTARKARAISPDQRITVALLRLTVRMGGRGSAARQSGTAVAGRPGSGLPPASLNTRIRLVPSMKAAESAWVARADRDSSFWVPPAVLTSRLVRPVTSATLSWPKCSRMPSKTAAIGATVGLHEALRNNPFLEGAGLSLRLSGSFGLATFPEDGDTVQKILRAADSMMYEAKTTRDNVAVAGRGILMDRPKLVVAAR